MANRAATIAELARRRPALSVPLAVALLLGARTALVALPGSEDPLPAAGPDAAEPRSELERERDRLRERVARLEGELATEREQRLEREQEWLRYTLAIAELEPGVRGELPQFGPHVPLVELAEDGAPRPTPEERAAEQRAVEVLASLRALLRAEGVRGLDLLEAGRPAHGATGPVVFRLLDESGRLAGSLFAERLRLEASRSGRTLTLLLEDGFESIGGERLPFDEGTDSQAGAPWRLDFPDIDPQPWIEALPELFAPEAPERLPDDGRWDLAWVQVELNELLRQETSAGWYRLRRLGGIQGDVLRDVHVEVLSPQGALERRLFADRLRLEPASRGVVLQFEDGVLVRGGQKTPFLEGRHRVYLPRARVERWREAGLPGFGGAPR